MSHTKPFFVCSWIAERSSWTDRDLHVLSDVLAELIELEIGRDAWFKVWPVVPSAMQLMEVEGDLDSNQVWLIFGGLKDVGGELEEVVVMIDLTLADFRESLNGDEGELEATVASRIALGYIAIGMECGFEDDEPT